MFIIKDSTRLMDVDCKDLKHLKTVLVAIEEREQVHMPIGLDELFNLEYNGRVKFNFPHLSVVIINQKPKEKFVKTKSKKKKVN